MDKEYAARILGVDPTAKTREIDAAYVALCSDYVNRSQHATDPEDRDVAHVALSTLQDAYLAITGTSVPDTLKPSRTPSSMPSSTIPRAATGVQSPIHRLLIRWFRKNRGKKSMSPSGKPGRGPIWLPTRWSACWPPSPERAVATGICTVMFLIALVILGSI